MIPLQNLDDQQYEDIVESALRRIPVLCPVWTDLNPHDPGVTLIELFAWLKEMQQYQLNRIPSAGQASLLRLIGLTAAGAAGASCRLRPEPSTGSRVLPEGLRFTAQGGVPFETAAAVTFSGACLESAFTTDGRNHQMVTDILREPDIHFHPFGERPVAGESALYLGFARLPASGTLCLHLSLDDRYPVVRNPFPGERRAPRDIAWEVGTADSEGVRFTPVAEVVDETFDLARTGVVSLHFGCNPAEFAPSEGMPVLFWLRIRLLRPGCEENPRLLSLDTDTVALTQRQTRCRPLLFSLHPADGSADLGIRHWLGITGSLGVFVRVKDGWRPHNGFETVPFHDGEEEFCLLSLADLPADMLAEEPDNLLVLCHETAFADEMRLGASNGLSGQRFPLACEGWVLEESLRVLALEEAEDRTPVWTEWRCVPSLSTAGPYERVFCYDRAAGEIVFGDNEQGAVPLASEESLLLAGFSWTVGEAGNLPVRDFHADFGMGGGFSAISLAPAVGGRDPESVPDAIERARILLARCTRAVTAADWETLAASTPGLRVGGVRALPGFDPDSHAGLDAFTPATVAVVVSPYAAKPSPVPDERFLQAVRDHLESHRLVTTRVKVLGPSYVAISVHAEVVAERMEAATLEKAVRDALEGYFAAIRGEKEGTRPAWGEPVRESALGLCVGDVPGILRVKRLVLGVRHPDCRRDRSGAILLPPQGLPCLGDVQVRLLQ